jgi:peroxidase
LQAGGPFYPVFTGRRDSTQSYFDEAMDEIPKPNDNITRTLFLFSRRGFDERETVNLLGTYCASFSLLLFFVFQEMIESIMD